MPERLHMHTHNDDGGRCCPIELWSPAFGAAAVHIIGAAAVHVMYKPQSACLQMQDLGGAKCMKESNLFGARAPACAHTQRRRWPVLSD